MANKTLFILCSLLAFMTHPTPSYAAVFKKLTLKDGSTLQGEVIETYQDRWFYQPKTDLTKEYVLLYQANKAKPMFHLVDKDKIKKSQRLSCGKSKYRELLIARNLQLNSDLVENQFILTGNEGHHKFEKMYGNFAWDIGLQGPSGKTYSNGGHNLEDYFVFSKPVHSPLNGRIIGVVKNQPDNPADPDFVTDLANKKNNYVTIQLDETFYLSVVHFKKDTISLEVGDEVKTGDLLGLVGNSGVSYTPHLHYTLYIYNKGIQRFISVPGI